MNWFRRDQVSVLNVHVGNDLESLCAQELPSRVVDRIVQFREQQSETPSLTSELIVIDTPVRVRYQESGDSFGFTLPAGRYLELGVISDKIHTILAAPQLRYLNQEGAIQLLTQLSDEAKRHQWTESERFYHSKELQRLLARETGYIYLRYVEFQRGRETLSLSLKRLEPPTLFPRRVPSYGFLVNVCWTDAD